MTILLDASGVVTRTKVPSCLPNCRKRSGYMSSTVVIAVFFRQHDFASVPDINSFHRGTPDSKSGCHMQTRSGHYNPGHRNVGPLLVDRRAVIQGSLNRGA